MGVGVGGGGGRGGRGGGGIDAKVGGRVEDGNKLGEPMRVRRVLEYPGVADTCPPGVQQQQMSKLAEIMKKS